MNKHISAVAIIAHNSYIYTVSRNVLPLSCYRKKLMPPQPWPPNSADLNLVDNSALEILQENVYKKASLSGAIDDATDEWLPQ